MDTCYLGESFEKKFKVNRSPISTASFKVKRPDGTIQDQGLMGIDGNILSFRFTPDAAGTHEIDITWATGQDIWRAPFLIEVRP